MGDASRSFSSVACLASRFEFVWERMGDGVFVHPVLEDGRPGPFEMVNPTACRMLGYSEAELLGMGPGELDDPDASKDYIAEVMQALHEERSVVFNAVQTHRDGRRIPVEVSASMASVEGRPYIVSVVRYLAANIDIRKMRFVEEREPNKDLLVRALFDAVPGPFYLIDGAGRYVQWNHYLRDVIIGCTDEQMYRVSPLEAVYADDREDVAQRLERLFDEGKTEIAEARLLMHGGPEYRWFLLTGSFIMLGGLPYVIGTGTDITMLKKVRSDNAALEEALQQSRKMEVIGRLAGGIAHDFNNILSVIIGHAESVSDGLQADSQTRRQMDAILKAADRSAGLTRQLLAFARKQPVRPKFLELDAVVGGMVAFLERLIHGHVALSWTPGAPGAFVLMDPSQVAQILTNLCINARDAIDGHGQIDIVTAVELHEGREMVLLGVKDNGAGIPPEHLGQVFEPFFTTKASKGTGLGLATVYGIVIQNGGSISVESPEGKGSLFRILIPRRNPEVDDDHNAQSGAAGMQVGPVERQAPRFRVLVVEDEKDILALCRVILEKDGYEVFTAGDIHTAIRLGEEYAGQLDLLLSDVVMPDMNGHELAGRVAALSPGIKVLYMSGYTADILARCGIDGIRAAFIQKPFAIDSLRRQVAALLRDSKGF